MGDRDRVVSSRWLALAALSPLLCARPAEAEPFQVGGGGVFLGYAVGDGGGFEWGIEGFATHYLEDHAECGDHSERHGVGPLLRLAMVNVSRLEVTAAAHGGGELPSMRSYFDIDGELGASLLLQKRKLPWVAPHIGVTFESLIFNAYLRHPLLTPTFSLGAGARYLPTFGPPGSCEFGRAYRSAGGRARLARYRWVGARECGSDDARRWAERAAEECASVPAFLQLAQELFELGAPRALVARALAAAREELGHTRATVGLAELFGDGALVIAPPRWEPRPSLPRPLALCRLVAETWLDGCLNEGLASAIAAAEAQATRVDEVAEVSRLLAWEEAGHAALAADILRWVASVEPALVRSQRVPASFGRAPSTADGSAHRAAMALSRDVANQATRELAALFA